jgi:hypothetical protein
MMLNRLTSSRALSGVMMLGAAAAALGGCGSSLTPPTAPATAVEACLQLQEAGAQRSARCNGGAVADWRAYAQSWDDCTRYTQHILDGQAEYRPQLFEACRAEYDKACDEVGSNCFYEVLHGLVPDGQHCQDQEVCGTYSGCLRLEGGTCSEMCVRLGNENETCGIYCGGTTPCFELQACGPGLACVNDVCVTTKSVGAPCGGGDLVPCAQPSFCTADPADPQSTGTCKKPVSGGTCRADAECPAIEFCLQGVCAPRLVRGASCSDAPAGCEAWTTCSQSTGTCLPAGKPGTPCLLLPPADGFPYCMLGTCGADNMCVANASPGGSCDGTGCAPGSSCDDASLMCVACGP